MGVSTTFLLTSDNDNRPVALQDKLIVFFIHVNPAAVIQVCVIQLQQGQLQLEPILEPWIWLLFGYLNSFTKFNIYSVLGYNSIFKVEVQNLLIFGEAPFQREACGCLQGCGAFDLN